MNLRFIIIYYYCCCYYYLEVLGFKFKALHLLDRPSLEPHPVVLFVLVILQVWSHIFAQGQTHSTVFLTITSEVAGMTDVHHHTQLIDWDESWSLFTWADLEP
jgi:hypothetical protein